MFRNLLKLAVFLIALPTLFACSAVPGGLYEYAPPKTMLSPDYQAPENANIEINLTKTQQSDRDYLLVYDNDKLVGELAHEEPLIWKTLPESREISVREGKAEECVRFVSPDCLKEEAQKLARETRSVRAEETFDFSLSGQERYELEYFPDYGVGAAPKLSMLGYSEPESQEWIADHESCRGTGEKTFVGISVLGIAGAIAVSSRNEGINLNLIPLSLLVGALIGDLTHRTCMWFH